MARILFIFAKLLLLAQLIFIKIKEEEWVQVIKVYGKPFVTKNKEHFSPLVNTTLHFLIVALGLNLLIIFLSFFYRKRQKLAYDKVDNVLAGMQNIYFLLMTGVVISGVLGLMGIDQKSLFTGLSIVAAAIAIITKDYIANIISGIAISFSDEISIGDYVSMDEHRGKVIDISISRLALQNDDDDIIYIPNNTFFTSEIVNYTKKNIRKVNIEFELDTSGLTTIEALETDLVETLADYHDHIEVDTFRLRVVEIRKDSLSLKFQFMLKHINRELEREIRRKTVRRVVNHIRNNQEVGD